MGNYDHYDEARAIANALDAQGRVKDAMNLREAITEGRSGTEIFMKLRFYSSSLKNDIGLTTDLRDRIGILNEYLEEALNS